MAIIGRRILLLGVTFGALLFAATPAATADEWHWSITPYFWAAGIEMDVELNDDPVVTADASFSDLLDKIDLAGLVHFEGQTGQVGFFLDLEFYGFDDEEKDFSGPGGAAVTADGELEQWIIEAGGLWNPSAKVTGFALLGGARILIVEQEVEIEVGAPISQSGETEFEETLVDVMLGGRYQHLFENGWSLGFRGDLSTGDTELTWNAVGNFGYSFGTEGRYTILAGYRHMVIDFEDEEGPDGGKIETEMTMTGPFAGFRFGF